MKLNEEQLIAISEIAIEAGKAASQLIAAYSQKEVKVEKKDGGESLAAQVVTEVDRMSQDLILENLQPTIKKYDLGLLAEESEDNESRFEKDYFWCIDPMDGTLSFTEMEQGYSVSIALVSRDGIPQIGVVVNPIDQTIYHAVKGVGAFKNGKKISMDDFSKAASSFTLVCDRGLLKHAYFKKTKEALQKMVTEMGLEELKLFGFKGGAVMSAMWVLENAPACFFKFPKKEEGGGSFWDYAATACIYNELGAIVSDIHGRPLKLNKKSVFMNECGVFYSTQKEILNVLSAFYSIKV